MRASKTPAGVLATSTGVALIVWFEPRRSANVGGSETRDGIFQFAVFLGPITEAAKGFEVRSARETRF